MQGYIEKDLGMHHQTFEKRLKDPEEFTFKEVIRIASQIDVDAEIIINLIYVQCVENRKRKGKK